ncbi:MAG: ATP-dependent metallopeptidase FtsH/Yme1/Tma family protein [Solirubrobacteraceae bacterium]
MIATTRVSRTAKIAACVALLACISLLTTAVASGAVAYQKESFAEYQQQLASGQVQAVTINKRVRSVRVTLKDGRYVLAKYKPKEEPAVAAALAAKHVPVTVLTPTEAVKELKAKPVHHKLRYIVGGIAIVVIVIVGAVLYIARKRKATQEE